MLDQDDVLSGILVLTTPGALAAVLFAYPFVVWWNRSFPDGTAAVAQRDPVTGQCVPARVVMSGGWSFASSAPASLLYALIKRALD